MQANDTLEKKKTLNSVNGLERAHWVSLELICIKSAQTHEETDCILVSCFGFDDEYNQWAPRWAHSKNECLPSLINLHALIHGTRQEQTYSSTPPLSAYSFVLNAFSHSPHEKKKEKKNILESARLASLSSGSHADRNFCMCILSRQIFRAGRCFTGFTREQLYPPRNSQTDTNYFDMSSVFFCL